jgi:hypothetical protein
MKLFSSLLGIFALFFVLQSGSVDAAKSTHKAKHHTTKTHYSTHPVKKNATSTASTSGKMVFAHFMVGIVSSYQASDWANDISLASASGIDGFALNIGADSYTESQLTLAYNAAG